MSVRAQPVVLLALVLASGIVAPAGAAGPAVSLQGSRAPKAVPAGATIPVTVTVANRAKRGRTPALQLRWYLSRDARLGKGDVALRGRRKVAALAPGKRSAAVTAVTIPARTRPGRYRLLVCAGRQRCAALGSVRVGPPAPDLVVATVGAPPAQAAPGARLSLPVDVRNAGGARAGASTVVLELRRAGHTTKLDPGRAVAPLAANRSSAGATDGRIPQSLAEGTYTVAACADAGGKVKEFSEANNCTTAKGQLQVAAGQPTGGAGEPTGGGPGQPGGGGGGGGNTPPPPPPIPVGAPLQPPANPTTTATDFGDSIAFLYTGADAPQQGVAAGAIDRRRVAVLRGRVVDRAGAPVGGARVTILDGSALGHVLSRADGAFDLAVNGGGLVTLQLTRPGYLPLQRQVDVPWQDYVDLPDAALTPVDSAATAITAGAAGWQAHQSTPITDPSGTRRSTLLFPPGTTATMSLPGGGEQALPALTVRATEFTGGDSGDEAMPGDLPAQSGYTYATEYSVDEALDAGATGVRFNQPIITYTSNFLGFPVGQAIPAGTYDPARGIWSAEDNGRVIKLLDATGAIDANGDGVADNAAQLAALNISDGERVQLAALYPAGSILWRVPEAHFSSKDYNWPYGPPPDAVAPNGSAPQNDDTPPSCESEGSIIDCESQVLQERLPIAGTPYQLFYNSQRVPGRLAARTLRIRLTGGTVPASLTSVELEVDVAGRTLRAQYPPDPNQHVVFTWDGKDAYDRPVQGWVPAHVRVGFTYDGVYFAARPDQQKAFGAFSGYDITKGAGGLRAGDRTRPGVTGVVSVPSRRPLTIWRDYTSRLGAWDQRGTGLGGWSLSVQHVYDPDMRVLLRGDGTTQSSDAVPFNVIKLFAGTTNPAGTGGTDGDDRPAIGAKLIHPQGLAAGADGSLYIADVIHNTVRRVDPAGTIHTIYGGGVNERVTGVAVTPANHVVVADQYQRKLFDVAPDGTKKLIAGSGLQGEGGEGEGGPATAANLAALQHVAVAPDGSVYFTEQGINGTYVRRVAPDGGISIAVGGGTKTDCHLRPRATDLKLSGIYGPIAVGPDGALYVVDSGADGPVVRRIGIDGLCDVVAGGGNSHQDGVPATQAVFYQVGALTVGRDGRIYIGEQGDARVIGPDGRIRTIAGTGVYGSGGDDGPTEASLVGHVTGLATGPDGRLFLSDGDFNRVRVVGPVLPGASLDDISIPSPDGNEVYRFDRTGRHLQTFDALTGAVTEAFTYDNAGRLTTITDRNGLATTIERDASGTPTAIVAPGGQRTTLTIDAGRWLTAVSDPGTNTTTLTHDAGGLLTSLTTPRGKTHTYTYDALGLLTQDSDPAGGHATLTRTDLAAGWEVARTTALNRTTTYRYERRDDGSILRRRTDAAGGVSDWVSDTDGTQHLTLPDGTIETWSVGPDPRFGLDVPRWVKDDYSEPAGPTWHATRTLTSTGNPVGPDTYKIDETVNGQHWHWDYDGPTRTMTRTSPEARTIAYTWDAKARPASVLPATGETPITFTYDARGNLTHLQQGARAVTYAYDASDRAIHRIDGLNRTWDYAYNAADHLTRVTTPGGRQYDIDRDADGNGTALHAPGGLTTTLGYDPLDRLTSYAAPNASGPLTQAFDADRALARRTLPGGHHVDHAYDTGGRLTSITTPEATTALTYTGTTDRVASATRTPTAGAATTTAFEYTGDLATRRHVTGAATGDAHYTFSTDLDVTSWTLDGGAAQSQARDHDRLTVADGPWTITRDSAGRITNQTAGGAGVASQYDGLGRLAHRTVTTSAGQAFKLDVGYDAADQVTSKTEKAGAAAAQTSTYAYDDDGELKSVAGAATEAYTYDNRGNRITGPTNAQATTFDSQDRVTNHAGTAYTNDADGFMTGRGSDTFTYGARGELLSATVGATTVTYAYDEVGRRVARTQGAATEQYLYLDPDDPWRVTASKAGGVTTMYHYDDDGRLIGLERSGTTYVVGTDQAGSVRLVADAATGTVVRATTYTAFGVPTITTNTLDLPIGFAGGLEDPVTGLVRFGARDYDPATGRFTARDPVLFGGGQFNLYAYAGGDPVGTRDPSGLGDGPMYGPGGPPPSQPPGYCGPDPNAREREVRLWDAMLQQTIKKFERTPDGPERDRLEQKAKDLWKTTHRQATEDSMPPPSSDGKPTSAAAFASSGAATKA